MNDERRSVTSAAATSSSHVSPVTVAGSRDVISSARAGAPDLGVGCARLEGGGA